MASLKKTKGEEDRAQAVAAAKKHEIDVIFAQKKRRQSKQQPEGFENGEETLGADNDKPIRSLKHGAAADYRDAARAKTDAAKKKSSKKLRKDKEEARARSAEGKEPSLKSRKTTQEGFKVYTEEELTWNKSDAGGTPLCPFDCSCCF